VAAIFKHSRETSSQMLRGFRLMNSKITTEYNTLIAKPYAPNLGAEVYGIDLSKGITDEQYTEIRDAFLKYQVLFFKNQSEIPPEIHVDIGKRFGTLHHHPAAPTMKGHPEVFEIHATKESKVANGEHWHSDVSCDEEPPLGTMLQIHILPQCGGDTMFNNMYTAYEALSEPIKDMISGLSALHSSEHFYKGRYSDRGQDDDKINYPEAVHPVVRTHPETGKKALFVNRTFTNRINELSKDESDILLDLLFKQGEHINHQIRYRWSKNDMAFWDNRCCMHHAIWDYWPEERKGRRVTIKGDRPR